ncbi:MAG: glucose-6-phosphate dehydrogenase assembly protein OpcA [Opitutales bacterium]
MVSTFNALPGLEVPVGEISQRLADLWTDAAASGSAAPAPDAAKATQVNVVLHLGFQTSEEDAVRQFAIAVEFSRRYPSRIVVLCPMSDEEELGVTEMRAKIFGECHLGKSKGDTRCVEFVMLSYPRSARRFLESQVSICLSTDLPLYYWAHRFSMSSKLAEYNFLLTRSTRVLLDSAIAPDDAMHYPWPNPAVLRDLVYSRLLPVRQTIGQFLASYPAEKLVGGLRRVTVTCGDDLVAEGRVVAAWLNRRLTACGVGQVEFAAAAGPVQTLAVAFAYAGANPYFRWTGDLGTGHAHFACDFGNGVTELPASVSLLAPDRALSEAMFN